MKSKALAVKSKRRADTARQTKPGLRLQPRKIPLSAHQPRQSLQDAAYEAVKHLIITCELRPGEYVNEAALSARLGIGRTPIHQALSRLMLEAMVDIIPRKGVVTKPISLDEIMQIIEARLLCEPYCIRLAAERAEDKDIAELERIVARAAASPRNIEELMLLDREFHQVILRAAKNDVLADILRKLHDRSLRFWFISLTAPGHHKSVQDEHSEILNAIRKRNANAAEKAMREHIESFRKNISRHL